MKSSITKASLMPSKDWGIHYKGISGLKGPLIFIDNIHNVAYDEVAEIHDDDGKIRLGKVLECGHGTAVIQMFGETRGLSRETTAVRFTGSPLTIKASRDWLGRIFNGVGQPIDGNEAPGGLKEYDINGSAINPCMRAYPQEFIQTGISSIDGLNTLVRGQKLPLFSCPGLPHDELAAQITRQAKVGNDEDEFVIIFAAMGISHDTGNYFRKSFEESGVLSDVVMLLNYADDPSVERLVTPRTALTLAEYLAYEEDMHVLVILTDLTSYCEALREVASAKGEIPSRKGYPGYLYSDLSSIYERAGRIKGRKGSITQIPIISMPNDDITHPIPDLTGFITEGQIVLGRKEFQQNLYPPVDIFPSLSRLMKDGIGEGLTRDDHVAISNQLYTLFARVREIEAIADVVGEDELSDLDRIYLVFGNEFKTRFLSQGTYEDRSIEETLDLAWEIASILPQSELQRIEPEMLKKRYVVK
jgi:V/A-type H+-transporting ATPase subunit B